MASFALQQTVRTRSTICAHDVRHCCWRRAGGSSLPSTTTGMSPSASSRLTSLLSRAEVTLASVRMKISYASSGTSALAGFRTSSSRESILANRQIACNKRASCEVDEREMFTGEGELDRQRDWGRARLESRSRDINPLVPGHNIRIAMFVYCEPKSKKHASRCISDVIFRHPTALLGTNVYLAILPFGTTLKRSERANVQAGDI